MTNCHRYGQRKENFLEETECIVPWGEWISLIQPHYYKGECGNKPYDLERMLRIYLVQNLYNLPDMATILVRYMNTEMRVANLISFFWMRLRVDLYTFP